METRTGVDWDKLLREEMNWAVRQKRNSPGDEDFEMRVKVVGPNGQIANTPAAWRSEEEKRRWMRAISQAAKSTCSQAVIVTSDARFLNVPVFCKRFGIAEPGPGTWDGEFERERRRVMKEFDFYMGNLPNDCYEENLLVAIHGPRVTRMAVTKYRVVEGKVLFEPMIEDKNAKIIVNLVPAWWQ